MHRGSTTHQTCTSSNQNSKYCFWHLTNLNTSYINCGNHNKNKKIFDDLLHLLLLVPLLAFFPFPPSGWVAANRRTINHQENVTNICSYFTNKNELLFYQSPNSALKCPKANFKWNSVQQILAYKAINHQINWEKKTEYMNVYH